MGDVANEITDLNIKYLKYSFGGGLRYLFSKKGNVNLRINTGINRGGNTGSYFGIEAAFWNWTKSGSNNKLEINKSKMKLQKITVLIVFVAFTLQNCSSTKVINAWKAEDDIVNKFKSKKVLVIARTANDYARSAFELAIANELRSKGIKATESCMKVPKIDPKKIKPGW